ncbi:CLUMA_CG016578, isoform A [Clunio marinus]|uniref:CLUMA_CG016578, isoform A n=1 Tax=Clunio marinus TaxID=568069 RepID=A0A1J1IT25_9DIPT|nr:CLUMA_CG016578, isoform A [Clunio marinus]
MDQFMFDALAMSLLCCTCWKSLERDKNDLFFTPKKQNVKFRQRLNSKSTEGCSVEIFVIKGKKNHIWNA